MNQRGRKPKSTLEDKLKADAESFLQTKEVKIPIEKPLNLREYIAGQAMSALILKSQGRISMADIKREAYSWADYFLKDN